MLAATVMLAAYMTGTLARAQQSESIPGTTVTPLKRVEETVSDPRLDLVGKLPKKVAVRPANAMGQEDKDLAASAAGAIRQKAEFNDLGFGEGDWQESQLDCPAFPQHLLLRFTRNRGAGDVTMFAASIPRVKEGRVRVIPILRRGYSLISPAPVNKLTIAAFNQIRAEEHMGEKADWLAVSLCYATLSSTRWNEPQGDVTLKPLGSDTIQLGEKGAVSIAVELGAPAPGRWVTTYDRYGQLEKTEYTPFGNEIWRPLPAVATELKGKPLPTGPEPQGKPLPSGPAPTGKPLPSGPPPSGQPVPSNPPGDSPNKPQ